MKKALFSLNFMQIKAIYEYFAKNLTENGKNPFFSYMIYKNAIILEKPYKILLEQACKEENKEFLTKTAIYELYVIEKALMPMHIAPTVQRMFVAHK